MKVNKKILNSALVLSIILVSSWLLMEFNFSWVTVDDKGATVTINFLLPMNKEEFEKCLKIIPQVPYANSFDCKVNWKTDHTVVAQIRERSDVKGQKILLQIEGASTKYPGIKKNTTIKIQFQTPVVILEPTPNMLIPTQNAFYIRFNTPMKKSSLYQYLESDGAFYINPVMLEMPNGEFIEDPTYFEFKPKQQLTNNKKYILSFKKGMPAQSGVLLEENMNVVLNTDKKPRITQTYPKQDSKWIGFYPKFVVETDRPIKDATLRLNDVLVKGKLKGDYSAEFLLPTMLKNNTEYTVEFVVEAPSGELSQSEKVTFRTAPVNDQIIWLEIIANDHAVLKVYKGEKVLKTVPCSVGKEEGSTPLGTYYAQEKGEKFFSYRYNEGANYWIKVTGDTLIQGITRDEYWNVKQDVKKQLGKMNSHGNIIVNEEDAKWLYDNIPQDTMVVIHP
ncbi:MAG: L,D-transpeptidase [Cellulosilyticaceae bacterium]